MRSKTIINTAIHILRMFSIPIEFHSLKFFIYISALCKTYAIPIPKRNNDRLKTPKIRFVPYYYFYFNSTFSILFRSLKFLYKKIVFSHLSSSAFHVYIFVSFFGDQCEHVLPLKFLAHMNMNQIGEVREFKLFNSQSRAAKR